MSEQWEMFCDEAYYSMWCVRKVGSKEFGEGFHVMSQKEAQALLSVLNTRPQPAIEGDVVGRVARAIAKEGYGIHCTEMKIQGYEPQPIDSFLDSHAKHYEGEAKAAIAAMQPAIDKAVAEERARCVAAEDALLSLTSNAVEGDYYESGDPEGALSGYWVSADVFDAAYDLADSIENERREKAIEQGGGGA